MKRRWIWIVLLVCVLIGGFVWKARRPGPAAPQTATQERRALEVSDAELFTIATGELARRIPLTGTLRAVQQAVVRAKVSGEILEIGPREGMSVKAGELVARIDPQDYAARVREREAQLRSAESQLAQAQRTRDHNLQLFERGFISRNAFDGLQSGYEVALGARDAAAEQLAQARKALADTAVLAPMSGIVAERLVQPGEKVSPDARIVTLLDLSRIEIEVPVPAEEIGALRIGQPVSMRVEGLDAPLAGAVARIAPATTSGTRTIPVWIGIDNRDPRVRAGMFAEGTLSVERRTGALIVPMAAVREAGGRSYVYRIADGRIEERTVRVGLRDEGARTASGAIGAVQIIEGLTAGDRIIGVNLGALRTGTEVRSTPSQGAAGNSR